MRPWKRPKQRTPSKQRKRPVPRQWKPTSLLRRASKRAGALILATGLGAGSAHSAANLTRHLYTRPETRAVAEYAERARSAHERIEAESAPLNELNKQNEQREKSISKKLISVLENRMQELPKGPVESEQLENLRKVLSDRLTLEPSMPVIEELRQAFEKTNIHIPVSQRSKILQELSELEKTVNEYSKRLAELSNDHRSKEQLEASQREAKAALDKKNAEFLKYQDLSMVLYLPAGAFFGMVLTRLLSAKSRRREIARRLRRFASREITGSARPRYRKEIRLTPMDYDSAEIDDLIRRIKWSGKKRQGLAMDNLAKFLRETRYSTITKTRNSRPYFYIDGYNIVFTDNPKNAVPIYPRNEF